MAAGRAEFVVNFPALFVAIEWVEAHCVIPDGFRQGEPFEMADWQAWFIVNHYRVKPDAELGQLAPAFHFRRSQLVMPQKAGKGPLTAAQVCLEGVGPALFAGWAEGGERWDCRDYGCGCGWVYDYEPGEAMGMPWPTPLVQLTATSEEQVANIYDALRPMIQKGPLADVISKVGEEFIRLPNDGRIDVVTSSATSRLGQRVTFCAQDETGIWTVSNKMVKVAETQRRGLAGMGGRAVETTNAWDPAEGSVAQRTAESKQPDIFRYHPEAPARLVYRDPKERRKIHEFVYADAPWVDLDAIEAEAAELLEVDPAQAERFFGNRIRAGEDAAFDPDQWADLTRPQTVIPDRNLVTVGVDGARFDDALGIVATDVESGHQWPVGIWERPSSADEDYEHPADEIDGAMVDLFDRFDVWRVYCDPQWIEHLMVQWQGRWTEKRVLPWYTNRPKQMAYALRAYRAAITGGDLSHDGESRFAAHIANAKKRPVNVRDEEGRPMWLISKDAPKSPRKMDAAMAAVLSWEARMDALSAGAKRRPRRAAPRRIR
jgi:hypothetical protein